MIKWIKQNWKDPVWSKVFASGIIFVIANIILLLWSAFKSIPVQDSYAKAMKYLTDTKYEVTLLSIVLVILAIIIILVTPLIIAMIRTNKHASFLLGRPANWVEIVDGTWTNEYRNADGQGDIEPLTIRNGTDYVVNGRLIFRLSEIAYDERARMIKWTKLRVSNNRIHSVEHLNILGRDSLEGMDSLGFTIRYRRAHA